MNICFWYLKQDCVLWLSLAMPVLNLGLIRMAAPLPASTKQGRLSSPHSMPFCATIPRQECPALPSFVRVTNGDCLRLWCLTLTNYGESAQLPPALPSTAALEHAGNFLLPPWNFNLRTLSRHTMPAFCADLEFTSPPSPYVDK